MTEYLLNEFDVINEDIELFKNDNAGLVGVDKSRISCLLYIQLASAMKHRIINSFSVTDVIQRLEGCGRGRIEKEEEQFKHPPLKGLWKAHYFDASFMQKNIQNELGIFSKKSKKLKKLINSSIESMSALSTEYEIAKYISHNIAVDGYEKRAKRKEITGEWLIYGKHMKKNYYLCIARHSRRGSDDDARLFDGLKSVCGKEFHFLFTEHI